MTLNHWVIGSIPTRCTLSINYLRKSLGRVVVAFGQFIGWIGGLVVTIVTALWFLGFDKSIRNYFHLP
jgi:hypothetical protein